jgi:predicted peptidase
VHGVTYHFQVYLPEDYRREEHHLWPIILFLHGRGERGADGMWQTQIGLPAAVRDHPERWPFVIVIPQCPFNAFWTDPPSLEMAMATLERETAEFDGDPERNYLTGLSRGVYGAWELARM